MPFRFTFPLWLQLPVRRLLPAVVVLGGSLLLFVRVGDDLGGGLPALPPLPPPPPLAPAAINKSLLDVFARATLAPPPGDTNAACPFYTAYFQPPPPPPPRTRRKIELTFQGYVETAHGEKRAYVLVGTNLVVGLVGTTVIADVTVADVALSGLRVKRGATQEFVVPFRAKKEIEIPVE